MHRQHVDAVGPVVVMSVAVAEQLRGDRVTVGLVVDQNAADRGRVVREPREGPRARCPSAFPRANRTRTLSGEELDALVAAMPDRYRTFVLVAPYSSPLLTWESLERTTGFEPATPTLARWCSTN
jgi:hypothetical protein